MLVRPWATLSWISRLSRALGHDTGAALGVGDLVLGSLEICEERAAGDRVAFEGAVSGHSEHRDADRSEQHGRVGQAGHPAPGDRDDRDEEHRGGHGPAERQHPQRQEDQRHRRPRERRRDQRQHRPAGDHRGQPDDRGRAGEAAASGVRDQEDGGAGQDHLGLVAEAVSLQIARDRGDDEHHQ